MLSMFGDKTVAFFDLWSLVHLAVGIGVGPVLFLAFEHFKPSSLENPFKVELWGNKVINIWFDAILVILIAYMWEFWEFGAENGWFGQFLVGYLDGVEFWGNRFIADPLLVYTGYVMGRMLCFDVPEALSTNSIFSAISSLILPIFPNRFRADLTLLPPMNRRVSRYATMVARGFLLSWLLLQACFPTSMAFQRLFLGA